MLRGNHISLLHNLIHFQNVPRSCWELHYINVCILRWGCVPLDNKCVPNMDQSLRTSIDVDGLVEKTKENLNGELGELSIQSSDDPGRWGQKSTVIFNDGDVCRYLCGFSYYLSLCNDNSKVLFIHIPPLNEEVTVQLLTRVVATIIITTLKHFWMELGGEYLEQLWRTFLRRIRISLSMQYAIVKLWNKQDIFIF